MYDQSLHISALVPNPDDPNQIEILVNDEPHAEVSIAIVDELQLSVGMEFSPELRTAIEEAIALAEARRIGFDLLGTRAYSSGELAERLERRSFSEHVVDEAVRSLIEDGWLDDHSYAVAVAEEILTKDAAGPAKLEEALRKRKIDPPTIAAVIESVLDDVNPSESAMAAARDRLASMGDVPPTTALRRLGGYLGRRGIDADVIEDVLNDLANEMGVNE